MRLFVAVNVDEQVKRRILAVQNRIREKAKQGKFSLPENIHLTLVFLGETAEERLPEIKDAIVRAASSGGKPCSAFELVFSRAGFFKRGAKELWWLGTKNRDKRLEELQGALAAEFLARNFFIDKRPFTPHITLGREIKSGLWPFDTEDITVPVKRISLMLSEHTRVFGGKNKLVYSELFKHDLT